MPDRGARYADKSIVKVIRSLKKTYSQAQKELESKLKDFDSRFEEKDKKKRQELADGKITEQQYKDWLSGQVFTRRQIENKIKQVSEVMLDYNNQAMNIINNSRLDVFAENYYSEAFRAQYIVNDLSFNVYNTQAIANLIKNNPQILPKWKIDEEKDYKWNYQKFNNIIQQGIIQGESVDQITKRLCRDLSSQNENKMRLFARTGITEAQNAGRQEQMEQAADLGIEINKRWMATLDERTRDSHRAMDGEEVPYDKKFSNGLEFPGDPSGSAAEVYNCRCTMVSIYPKYEDRSKNFREDVTIDGLSYEEWKKGKADFSGVKSEGDIGQLNRGANYVPPTFTDERKYMQLVGIEMIKGNHTIEDDAKACNPFFTRDEIFQTGANCQRCVNAYVARRRGYNVRAQRRYFQDDRYARGVGYKSVYNTKEHEERLAISIFEKGLTNKTVRERFENLMLNGIKPDGTALDKPLPDGTIMILGGYWSSSDALGISDGHLFIAEKRDGKIVYVDPQSSERDASTYFDLMTPMGMSYFRADDKEFNKDILEVVEKDDLT